MNWSKHQTFILLGFILVKFILQYNLISPVYDLQRDEFLHLDQAHHLAWGYLSVPPVTSWISLLILWLGNTVFWVKFFPALFGALTIVVVWKAIEELGGNLFALILGATCILFSVLLRLNTLYQPNSLDVLCWTSLYYFLIRYFKTVDNRWLYVCALVFSVGLLNKYNIVFALIGLLPAILISKQRTIFQNKHLYIAILLGVILVLPNLLWQYNNNFPVIHHLNDLAATQLVNNNIFNFLKSQLLFYAGCIFVIYVGLYALLAYPQFEKYKSLFWSIFITLFVFIFLRAKDYYAIGVFPIYISFGSVFLGEYLKVGWKKYLKPVLLILPFLYFMFLFNIAFPNKSPESIIENPSLYKKLGLLRWEDGRDHHIPQDFADMVGWKQLALKVDSIFSRLPNPDQTLVLCDNYGQAGAINYYKKDKNLLASSFNADYINWLDLGTPIVDVILVKEPDDDDKMRTTEIPLFDTVYLAGQRIHTFAREDTISIYVLQGAKVNINERIRGEAVRRKRRITNLR